MSRFFSLSLSTNSLRLTLCETGKLVIFFHQISYYNFWHSRIFQITKITGVIDSHQQLIFENSWNYPTLFTKLSPKAILLFGNHRGISNDLQNTKLYKVSSRTINCHVDFMQPTDKQLKSCFRVLQEIIALMIPGIWWYDSSELRREESRVNNVWWLANPFAYVIGDQESSRPSFHIVNFLENVTQLFFKSNWDQAPVLKVAYILLKKTRQWTFQIWFVESMAAILSELLHYVPFSDNDSQAVFQRFLAKNMFRTTFSSTRCLSWVNRSTLTISCIIHR